MNIFSRSEDQDMVTAMQNASGKLISFLFYFLKAGVNRQKKKKLK